MKNAHESTTQRVAGKRNTVWQLDRSLHCSIIGSCLNRIQIRRIARKKVFALGPNCSDYEIHQALVKAIAERNAQSRTINRYLDTIYRAAIRRYQELASEEAIRSQWHKDIGSGDAAGAYWAVLTHPCMNNELASVIYGECHMFSFDAFDRNRKQGKKVALLMQKIAAMDKDFEKERNTRLRYEQQMKTQENEHVRLQEKQEERELELASLRKQNVSLKRRLEAKSCHLENRKEEGNKLEHWQEAEKLRALIVSLEERLQRKEKEVATLFERHREYRRHIDMLTHRLERQNHEKAVLESTLLNCACDEAGCDTCSDKGGSSCPGPNLCGKTVLYVGGQRKMIPRYKELVEKHGATFLHHDGGRETSHHVLCKMLVRADAVFCPVDCVSHEACKRVKKSCKRSSKPFVMMRSSGLTSLAKGLQSMIQ